MGALVAGIFTLIPFTRQFLQQADFAMVLMFVLLVNIH
jgi:hypothetical protein